MMKNSLIFRNRSNAFKAGLVLLAYFFYFWGIVSLIPVTSPLITSLCNGDIGEASFYIGVITACGSLTTIFSVPILGAISDVHGRRPILLLSLIGQATDLLGLILAYQFQSLWILFITKTISGLGSGFASICFAAIADLSSNENRAKYFGMTGISMGAAFLVGPMGSIFLGQISLSLPLAVGLIVVAINFIFIFVAVPESLMEPGEMVQWKKALPILSLRMLNRSPLTIYYTVIFLLIWLGEDSLIDIFAIYFIYRFGWEVQQLGMFMLLVGLVYVLSQGVVLRIFVRCIGDRKSLMVSLLINAISFLLFPHVTQMWLIFAGMSFRLISLISAPLLQGIISRHFPPSQQGELNGVLGAVKMFANLVMPLMATNLFSFFISPKAPSIIPGIVFYVASFIFFVATLIAAFAFWRYPDEPVSYMPLTKMDADGVELLESEELEVSNENPTM